MEACKLAMLSVWEFGMKSQKCINNQPNESLFRTLFKRFGFLTGR